MKIKLATLLAGLSLLVTPLRAHAQNRFTQVNLQSDVSGEAQGQDTNLVNPWGLAPGGNCTFWVSNNGTGTSTLYSPEGVPTGLVVTIPGGSPTGVVLGNTTNLRFSYKSNDSTATARFIFVGQTGVISAWSPTFNPSNAIQVATNDGANYTGAALASTASGARLYAANFGECTIDVYDSSFVQVTPTGSFTDPNLPAGYCPFNIANINGQLYVAYALKGGDDEVPGAGNGFIDVYDTSGNFLSRFASDAELNAPWAMVVAPACFGDFAGDLLVGNFGDGRILAYSLGGGAFQGALHDSLGNTISVEGLWGLATCGGAGSEVACRLYFAAGIDDETHGLFGYIRVAGEGGGGGGGGGGGETCDDRSRGLGFWARACGTHGNGHGGGIGNPGGNGNNGHGNNGKDKGKGQKAENDKNPDANGMGWAYGHDKDRGHGHGVSSDSLDAMFSCITGEGGAFGSGGCFTAGCDLLAARGQRSAKDKVAQQFLVLLLNRCAGLICDGNEVSLSCLRDTDDDDEGDDDGEDADTLDMSGVHTIGDLIGLANDVLCDGDVTSGQLEDLKDALECALEDGDDEEDSDLRTLLTQRHGVSQGGLQVKTLSGNPLRPSAGISETRIQLSTDHPVMVQLGIYDTQGRLVARLLRDVAVAGQTEVRWNGRGLQGGLVPAGTYFYRAIGGRSVATGRIVVLK